MIAGVTLPRPMLLVRPADAVMTPLAVLAIDAYRRFVSPRKGFSCPHRLLHGGRSCSAHGRLILKRAGVFQFRVLMRRRFDRCRAARLQLVAMAEFWPGRAGRQRHPKRTTFREECRDSCWESSCERGIRALFQFVPDGCVPDACDCDCSP